MKYNNISEFYPTPVELVEKMLDGIDWTNVKTILEPSAGKGDIINNITKIANDYFENKYRYWNSDKLELDIDCIEIDAELQATLKGQNLKLIHDDFLTFNTFKRYDLIVMNPPFSNGCKHLLKAIRMQKDGGGIVCLLNAETIRNPYSNERKELCQLLDEYNATIEFLENSFIDAERKTEVEVVLIKLDIPKKEFESDIYNELKRKKYAEYKEKDITDVALNDYIKMAVMQFNLEVEAGIKLIHEYEAMKPYLQKELTNNDKYESQIIEMEINNRYGRNDKLTVNNFVKCVRRKYWCALFNNNKFTGNMTSNLLNQYRKQVENLTAYDFSEFNIKSIQEDMSKNLIKGIEDCIIEKFDELSRQYAYDKDLCKNIHYYNGWKTNKSWIINKKVIIPYMNAFDGWDGMFEPWRCCDKLSDIEKALNYLDGGLTDSIDLRKTLEQAKEDNQTKKIQLKYFKVTFYKKGTCHLEFTNLELLKKFNIFGSQQKGWLPKKYGNAEYKDMTAEEQNVINEFEGEVEYKKTMANKDYYIYNPEKSLPQLEDLQAS